MSAIFGVYNRFGEAVASRLLEGMSNVLSHRGSDGSGIWNDGLVGFGHRMKRTTPEAQNETLPLINSDSTLAITADARLDNRDELIYLIGSFGRPHALITDSDLILASYEKWGEGCAEHLLGDFAFAIWDSRKRQLYCARDHFGVKPFYYHLSEKLFVFASEIKALLLSSGVPRRINEIRLVNHLRSRFEDKVSTFYADILRLRPGHAMTIGQEGNNTFSYWSLELGQELKLKSDEEYAEALSGHFTEAVRCRLRSSVPLGTMLSGGIDSSSITCMARRLLAENGGAKQLHTFSAVFDDVKECDEREFMNTVISGNSIRPHFAIADKYGPFVDVDKMLQVQDEPLYSGNLYLNWLSYKKAQDQGVKVILDGFDGDNTISHGLGYFTELAHGRRWMKLASEVRAFSKKINMPWAEAFWSWFWFFELNPMISGNRLASRARSGVRRVKRKVGIGKQPANLARNFSSSVGLNPVFETKVASWEAERTKNPSKPRTERETHLRNLLDNGSPFVLEVLDRASGAFSVEMRFPFWDKRLIEFCLSVPAEQKIKNGWTRVIMRRAMTGILPPEIQWRPGKTDMTPSFNYGFLKFGRGLMKKFIIDDPETIVDYIDIKSLREAHGRFLNSQASDNDIMAIQRSVSLALWLQKIS